jgi:hypothetical protein
MKAEEKTEETKTDDGWEQGEKTENNNKIKRKMRRKTKGRNFCSWEERRRIRKRKRSKRRGKG